ncbi:hypothetical protein FOS14_04880 [Skermania sp. ID1734]|uniref:hypothetical protein n=1 Tax=Skermania sp. ID1734 TaxID=2597516 RepID=UPI001180E5F1|nr:hypothetical protein [Skermania sp. ID1734]TSE01086.1 hypothetical protein FOS14_04880 [Skermania sp. ID1734]
MAVAWSDDVDDVIRGDLTCGLGYVTPAGGAVVTAVAPIGMRDRDAGTVGFTTSLGFGRKLERIKADPKIALAYHAREHGIGAADNEHYVLVQGIASFEAHPDQELLERVGAMSVPYLGAPRRGPFWDRWLRAYYADRVVVTVAVTRIATWPNLAADGRPEVSGEPMPEQDPAAQQPPKNGTRPRVDAVKTGERAIRLPHCLLAYRQADGYPIVLPVKVTGFGVDGVHLKVPAGTAEGGRRAGLLAHAYRAKLIGLESRQNTGWLEVSGVDAVYSPHTQSGFAAPPNKTILLLGNGFLARRGLAQARKTGRIDALA